MFGFKKESKNVNDLIVDCKNTIKECQENIELQSIAAIEDLIKEIRNYGGSMKTEANINLKIGADLKKLESLIALDPITRQKIFLKGNNNIDIVQELSAFDQELLENAALICAIYEKGQVKSWDELLADKKISGLNYTQKLNHFVGRIKNLKTPKHWYSNNEGVSLSKKHSKKIVKYSIEILYLIEVMLRLDCLFKGISNVKNQPKKYFLPNLKRNNVLKPLEVDSYFKVEVAGKLYHVSCCGKRKLGNQINEVYKNWPKYANGF